MNIYDQMAEYLENLNDNLLKPKDFIESFSESYRNYFKVDKDIDNKDIEPMMMQHLFFA